MVPATTRYAAPSNPNDCRRVVWAGGQLASRRCLARRTVTAVSQSPTTRVTTAAANQTLVSVCHATGSVTWAGPYGRVYEHDIEHMMEEAPSSQDQAAPCPTSAPASPERRGDGAMTMIHNTNAGTAAKGLSISVA